MIRFVGAGGYILFDLLIFYQVLIEAFAQGMILCRFNDLDTAEEFSKVQVMETFAKQEGGHVLRTAHF